MRKISPFSRNDNVKLCAGCDRPFVIRNGWSEAIVGRDARLYCYATSCEADAAAACAPVPRRAA